MANATETSRTFDLALGAVHLGVRDSFGTQTFHTFYVVGLEDVDTAIAARIADVETQAELVRSRMTAAGWSG